MCAALKRTEFPYGTNGLSFPGLPPGTTDPPVPAGDSLKETSLY